MGVIAPMAFIPEIERMYKLPENKIIPMEIRMPDQGRYLDFT
jgi:hypothetical protein